MTKIHYTYTVCFPVAWNKRPQAISLSSGSAFPATTLERGSIYNPPTR